MGVQQTCDVAEAGKLFSGAAKRSNFHNRRNCAIQSTEVSALQSRLATIQTMYFSVQKFSILPTMHFVCCVSFSLCISWSQWWDEGVLWQIQTEFLNIQTSVLLQSWNVYCISGSLPSHTISILTCIQFSQWSITSFPFHTQKVICCKGILCNNTWPW